MRGRHFLKAASAATLTPLVAATPSTGAPRTPDAQAERLRMTVDADTAREIDDLYAIVRALLETPLQRQPGSEGVVAFRVEIPVAGRYTVWARTIARTHREDSFSMRVNGEHWIHWNAVPLSDSWRWSPVHGLEIGGELMRFELRPGENLIEFAPRESGTGSWSPATRYSRPGGGG